jgi:hypothetical protein
MAGTVTRVGRPRLGPPVTFRLPLELHAVLTERAEAHGITPDEYVRTRFVTALEAHLARNIPDVGDLVEPRWKTTMKGTAS